MMVVMMMMMVMWVYMVMVVIRFRALACTTLQIGSVSSLQTLCFVSRTPSALPPYFRSRLRCSTLAGFNCS